MDSSVVEAPVTAPGTGKTWMRLLLGFAALKIVIQVVGNALAQHAGYGIFRDEMYLLVCGRRPALGYVDQPFFSPMVLAVSDFLFGHTQMWAFRLLPAIAGGAKVFLTGSLARALGGSLRAAALAMLAVICCGVYLAIDGYDSMNAFEPLFWMTCCLAVIQLVRGGDPRLWWIVFGVSAGIGFENKISEAFFLVCLFAMLLGTPQRRILLNRWFFVSVGLIALLALPYAVWQMQHQFPTLEWLHQVEVTGKDVKLPPLQFILAQVLMLYPWNVLLWGPGVLWLLLAKSARSFRFLGFTYLLFLAFMMAMHAKDYYLAPIYPVYFAAGAVARFAWAGQVRWRNGLIMAFAVVLVIGFFVFVPFSIPVLPPQNYVVYARALHMGVNDSEVESVKPKLPQFYADRFGWSELVSKVAGVYHSLPPAEQAVTGIWGQNYGEAGAIDVLGRPMGLPEAISDHQNYWIWGPGKYTGQEMIIITGADMKEMLTIYDSCTLEGRLENPWVMPYELNRPIYLCRGRKIPYRQDWADNKLYR
jgi:hypothetical protein